MGCWSEGHCFHDRGTRGEFCCQCDRNRAGERDPHITKRDSYTAYKLLLDTRELDVLNLALVASVESFSRNDVDALPKAKQVVARNLLRRIQDLTPNERS